MGARDPYFELAGRLERPTALQTREFAEYVSGAHSWYKHLPLLPPGAAFSFYLDPNAGRTLTRTPNGAFLYVDRLDEEQPFHYTWMPTAAYRAKHGFWQYETDSAPAFLVGSDRHGLDILATRSSVLDRRGAWVLVPREVMAAGACRLTALVHKTFNPLGFRHGGFDAQLDRFAAWSREHPDAPESGAYRDFLRLGAKCRRDGLSAEERRRSRLEAVAELRRLHAFERDRLKAAMAAAMRRVLVLIYG